jgi:uncharacterized membrane protein YgcG
MADEQPKNGDDKPLAQLPAPFGKRGAKPIVTRKPKTPAAGSSGQKRTLAISLVAMGALSLGAYEAIDWLDRKLNCEPDPNKPEELICKHSSSGSSYRRSSSSGWHWSSGGGSSSHGFSFGGFGHSGGGFSFGG